MEAMICLAQLIYNRYTLGVLHIVVAVKYLVDTTQLHLWSDWLDFIIGEEWGLFGSRDADGAFISWGGPTLAAGLLIFAENVKLN